MGPSCTTGVMANTEISSAWTHSVHWQQELKGLSNKEGFRLHWDCRKSYQPLTVALGSRQETPSPIGGKWKNTRSLALLYSRKLMNKWAFHRTHFQAPNQIPPDLLSSLLSLSPRYWKSKPRNGLPSREVGVLGLIHGVWDKDGCNSCFGSLVGFKFAGRSLKVKDLGSVRMSHLQ